MIKRQAKVIAEMAGWRSQDIYVFRIWEFLFDARFSCSSTMPDHAQAQWQFGWGAFGAEIL